MPEIRTTAHIRRPADEVFAYVTTPAHWPAWHPSSVAVSGATDHSLEVGERVREEFRVAGQRGAVTWVVRERDAPRRWVIAGASERGDARATIAYTLTPTPDGTTFDRVLTYPAPPPHVDPAALEAAVRQESDEALRGLKAALEGAG